MCIPRTFPRIVVLSMVGIFRLYLGHFTTPSVVDLVVSSRLDWFRFVSNLLDDGRVEGLNPTGYR